MCDEWMPLVKFPVGRDVFHQLPRNPAYKYEYLEGSAYLSPRPRTFHARLDLTKFAPTAVELGAEEYDFEPARPEGIGALADLFASAFDRVQPFSGLEFVERRRAAELCLERTFSGGDGPWAAAASFGARSKKDGRLVGAILVTLLPDGDPADPDTYQWSEPAPPDLWSSAGGLAHLTWVFVGNLLKGSGIGTRLLAQSAEVLRQRGDRRLLTTFLTGNDSSMLWHWRNGFELVSHDFSKRARHARLNARG